MSSLKNRISTGQIGIALKKHNIKYKTQKI